MVFGSDEVGQHFAPALAGVAQVPPVVEVVRVATDDDHGVDRARSTQALAAFGRGCCAARSLYLESGRVTPILIAIPEQRPLAGMAHHGRVTVTAGFDQRHLTGCVFRQASGQHTAGGPRTDDHEERIQPVGHRSLPRGSPAPPSFALRYRNHEYSLTEAKSRRPCSVALRSVTYCFRRDRAGPLRRGLPDADRVGPAPGLAGGGLPRRRPTRATPRSSPASRTSSSGATDRYARARASPGDAARGRRGRAPSPRAARPPRGPSRAAALVEAEIAGELEALRGHRLLPATIDRVLHEYGSRTPCGVLRADTDKHATVRPVRPHADHGIRLARRRREPGAVALERATQLDGEGREVVARRHVHAAARPRAAAPRPAGGSRSRASSASARQRENRGQGPEAHSVTPPRWRACRARTRTCAAARPSMKRCTFASASAAARTVASSAPAGTVTRPRSLPFTCTTTSTLSRSSAAGRARASARRPARPHGRVRATARGRRAARSATAQHHDLERLLHRRARPCGEPSSAARRARSAVP